MKQFTKNRNIRNLGHHPASNIVEEEKNPLGPVKDVTGPLEAWQLFVKDEFLGKIVTNTNRKYSRFRDTFQETPQPTTKYTYCKTTDLIEIKAFFSFLYLREAIKFNTIEVGRHCIFS